MHRTNASLYTREPRALPRQSGGINPLHKGARALPRQSKMLECNGGSKPPPYGSDRNKRRDRACAVGEVMYPAAIKNL